MAEPIHLQVNVLQGDDVARQMQAQKDVTSHQQIGQEEDRVQESQQEETTVQESPESQESELDPEGSGRGRAFLRKRRTGGEEEEEDEEVRGAPEPNKGIKVDLVG
ncbi:MAG: hypothetical protein D6679_04520 [Candidatus Hydrogenedentota bacterium]|nr:MAG: hypothetical protein D6679_04520 [Candidatus Hydrogenedentota bacterium]